MSSHGFPGSAALPLALFLVSACGGAATAPDAPAAVMIGEWRYARAAPAGEAPSLHAGFFVTIAIDSAVAMRFWGRVTAWFVGDVGLGPDRFGPVTGAVDEGSGVTLLIAPKSNESAHSVRGEIDGDVILVSESWTGPEIGPFAEGERFQRLH